MTGSFHTLAYPISLGALRSDLAFPSMVPGDRRTYLVSMADFCASAGATLEGVTMVVDATLGASLATVESGDTTFLVTVWGGDELVPFPPILFVADLSNGDDEKFTVVQPMASLTLPAGTLPSGAQLTAAFHPIDVSALLVLAGGVQNGDLVLALRNGLPGLLPASSGGEYAPTDYAFVQASPAATWTITHNLGRHPSVEVVTTAGDLVDSAVNYPSANQVVLSFASAFAGTAYLN